MTAPTHRDARGNPITLGSRVTRVGDDPEHGTVSLLVYDGSVLVRWRTESCVESPAELTVLDPEHHTPSLDEFVMASRIEAARSKATVGEVQDRMHRDTAQSLLAAVRRTSREHGAGDFAAAYGLMLAGWMAYADAHRAEFELDVRDDGVLDDPWERIGLALRELLNGEIGSLDAGQCDQAIVDRLRDLIEGDAR